ncbi:enolase C-terminal domain-like protein [Microbacterium sp. NRRL B-14842]|uniref:enolase C-terminal domain-like protein n=1 Tax=Microbacterium sp. NRRL B-14842 TaxID=3162881 RepID=UPI003D2728A2
MIEQPFAPRDLVAHADLQARLDTDVCLDESVVDLGDLRTMIRLGAGRVLNIKVSRMGGLTVARGRARHGTRCGHPGVVRGECTSSASGGPRTSRCPRLPGFLLPSDVSGSDKYYESDIITPPVTAVAGRVTVPTGPGIGPRGARRAHRP